MLPAILSKDKVVTGFNHGDAYSRLSTEEKENVISGFLDEKKLKFITDEYDEIYLKDIIIIRHAQCDCQDFDRCINEVGRGQAIKTAIFLCNINLQDFSIYTSPYQRCVDTTKILSEQTHINYEVNEQLAKQEQTENFRDFEKRIKNVLDNLPKKSMIITHSDFVICLLKFLLNTTVKFVPNCSITYTISNRVIWMLKEI